MSERVLRVEHEGEMLLVVYETERVPEAVAAIASGFGAGGEDESAWAWADTLALIDSLDALVVAWSVTAADGRPVAPTAAAMADAPLAALRAVGRGVAEDVFCSGLAPC